MILGGECLKCQSFNVCQPQLSPEYWDRCLLALFLIKPVSVSIHHQYCSALCEHLCRASLIHILCFIKCDSEAIK